VDSIYDIVWARDPLTGRAVTYGEVRFQEELQFSVYNFEAAEVEKLWEHLRMYEAECQTLLASFQDLKKLEPGQKAHERLMYQNGPSHAEEDVDVALRRFPVLAAYDLCLKCSHLFNLLDARGAISVTERVGVIARIRNLAVGVAKAYAAQQISH
jgi:glycyl-tRNA synthetase alpha chain